MYWNKYVHWAIWTNKMHKKTPNHNINDTSTKLYLYLDDTRNLHVTNFANKKVTLKVFLL